MGELDYDESSSLVHVMSVEAPYLSYFGRVSKMRK